MANGATVGSAVIKLEFDGKDVKAELSNVENEVKKSGSRISSALGTVKTGAAKVGKAIGASVVAGTAAAGAAVVGLGKTALKSFSDFEQLSGGIEAMFGGYEKGSEQIAKVMESSANAWKNLTMSQNDYFQSFASSYPLMKADIEDENQAIDATNRLMQLNADLSNTFGYSIEQASTAINWALKGSFNYIDNLNLGIKGTQEGFLEAAHSVGYMVDNVTELTSEQILDILEKYAAKFGVIGRTAQEADKTIAGSVKSMKASWANLMTGIARDDVDFSALVNNFVESLTNVFTNLKPRIKVIAEGISKLVEQLGPILAQMIPEFIETVLPSVIQALIQLAVALIPQIPTIIRILVDALIQNLPMIIEGIKQLIPQLIGLIPELVGAALQIFGAVAGALFEEIGKFLGMIGEKIGQAFEGIWNGVCAGAQAAWQGIQDIFGSVAEFFGSIFSAAWEAVKAVFSTGGRIFMGIVDGILNGFKVIVNAIIGGINAVVAIPFNGINGFLSFLRGIDILGIRPFEWVGNIDVPQIPYLAKGGYADGATNAVIGEAGKEVVLPLENNTDNWAGLLASTLAEQFEQEGIVGGREIVVNMTNEINNEMDAQDIGRVLMESIRRAA